MPCYHPIDVFVTSNKISSPRTVPCGACIGCRSNQARDWAIRILHESRMHETSWFLTLTYKDEEIPQHGTLYPEDLRILLKNLRGDLPPKQFSYYACGEYGGDTERPHYHAAVYGPDFLDKYPHPNDGPHPVWRASTLEDHWKYGHSEFSTITAKSASYIAGYVRKKIGKKANPEHYTRLDPDTGELIKFHPEFSRMSLKPAIGNRWIQKYWEDVYPRDFVVMDGKEFKPPRYYDKWMDQTHKNQECGLASCVDHQRIMFDVKIQRDQKAKHIPEEKIAAKEKIHEARWKLFEKRGKI